MIQANLEHLLDTVDKEFNASKLKRDGKHEYLLVSQDMNISVYRASGSASVSEKDLVAEVGISPSGRTAYVKEHNSQYAAKLESIGKSLVRKFGESGVTYITLPQAKEESMGGPA